MLLQQLKDDPEVINMSFPVWRMLNGGKRETTRRVVQVKVEQSPDHKVPSLLNRQIQRRPDRTHLLQLGKERLTQQSTLHFNFTSRWYVNMLQLITHLKYSSSMWTYLKNALPFVTWDCHAILGCFSANRQLFPPVDSYSSPWTEIAWKHSYDIICQAKGVL